LGDFNQRNGFTLGDAVFVAQAWAGTKEFPWSVSRARELSTAEMKLEEQGRALVELQRANAVLRKRIDELSGRGGDRAPLDSAPTA